MYRQGERVTYIGDMAEVKGMPGVVRGAGSGVGRTEVEWLWLGSTVDMSDTVLAREEPKGNEMAKGHKTVVTHPDGTQSTRNSATMTYTHAVEIREDRHALAKLWRKIAEEKRAERERFITAVRAGRISVRPESALFETVYLLGEGGEEWYIGANMPDGPLDRKQAIRAMLADFESFAARYEADADSAEAGPQFGYGVVRWSQSEANARKGLAEFERNRASSDYRVVPVD